MTEERKPVPAGQEKDDRVIRAYRELATERAPDHLDRAVLGKARAAARPRYSRLRSWTRPLAWAATQHGLCNALVYVLAPLLE